MITGYLVRKKSGKYVVYGDDMTLGKIPVSTPYETEAEAKAEYQRLTLAMAGFTPGDFEKMLAGPPIKMYDPVK